MRRLESLRHRTRRLGSWMFSSRWTFMRSLRFRLMLQIVLALGAMTALSGCMLTRPDSGPTFSLVEEHLVPENRTAQYALLPVFIPIGTVAALTDAAIVHPAMILEDTASDTQDVLWSHFRWDEAYMTECAALPWRVAATPIFFSGMWLGRVLFEIPGDVSRLHDADSPEAQALRDKEAGIIAEAKELMAAGNPDEALKLLIANQTVDWSRPQEEQQEYVLLMFRAALDGKRYEVFEELMRGPYFQHTATPEFGGMIDELLASESPYARSVAYGWRIDVKQGQPEDARAILHQMLNDESEVVRALALQRIQPWSYSRESMGPELETDLERIKTGDASAYNRDKAAAVLRQVLEGTSNPSGF